MSTSCSYHCAHTPSRHGPTTLQNGEQRRCDSRDAKDPQGCRGGDEHPAFHGERPPSFFSLTLFIFFFPACLRRLLPPPSPSLLVEASPGLLSSSLSQFSSSRPSSSLICFVRAWRTGSRASSTNSWSSFTVSSLVRTSEMSSSYRLVRMKFFFFFRVGQPAREMKKSQPMRARPRRSHTPMA